MPERSMVAGANHDQVPTVAYVLKSFPRLSETFIASEIFRLEQLGVRLRLFVIKRSDERLRHPVVDAIQAPRVDLPEAAPVSGVSLVGWLAQHLPSFTPALLRVLRRHPVHAARSAAMAAAQALRARPTRWSIKKAPVKEWLQAVALADAIATAGDVRHVHAHFCHSATMVAWLAAVIEGLPLSFTAHAKDVYQSSLNPAGLLDRKLRAARFVITCTATNQRHLQARTATPVYCLYHGLNVEFARLCAERSRSIAPSGGVRVLAVGRLVEKKGFDVLLDACARLRQRGVSVEGTIVGEPGEHGAVLREQAARLGLTGCVTFAGPMSQSELFEQYARATVFCLPCRVLENGDRDGIPNVIAEAMACGLPVVTTNASGAPELMDNGVSGIVVPPDDAIAVADAIEMLHRQPEMAESLAREARRAISTRFNGDVTARALSTLLQEAVAC
jgi:glycosyltransferase involved in cell wall biosynthesis